MQPKPTRTQRAHRRGELSIYDYWCDGVQINAGERSYIHDTLNSKKIPQKLLEVCTDVYFVSFIGFSAVDLFVMVMKIENAVSSVGLYDRLNCLNPGTANGCWRQSFIYI